MKSKREKSMMTQEKVARQCVKCKNVHILLVNSDDLQQWKDGELIQDAMPYLSADERELLISGTCGTCFDKMFGGEE